MVENCFSSCTNGQSEHTFCMHSSQICKWDVVQCRATVFQLVIDSFLCALMLLWTDELWKLLKSCMLSEFTAFLLLYLSRYRFDLSVEEAAELARRAIYHATFRDGASGGVASGMLLISSPVKNNLKFKI